MSKVKMTGHTVSLKGIAKKQNKTNEQTKNKQKKKPKL